MIFHVHCFSITKVHIEISKVPGFGSDVHDRSWNALLNIGNTHKHVVTTNMKSALTTQIHPGFTYHCEQRRNVLDA
jgi:hypothetical protein